MSITLLLFCLNALETRKLVYAAGYIPNVQFAPFYVAASRGYYKEEGIELEMDYTMGPEIYKLVALGKVHMGSADPDAFLHATVRGLPLVHVATLYQSYPIALIAREDILNRDALRNKRIGISGTYGSSYLGLKAIMAQMGLDLRDVRVASIGFTQAAALSQGRVDAVVGYVNNEPLHLEQQGILTHIYTLTDSNKIPGVGVMAGKEFLAENGDLVKGFLRATFRGMHDAVVDPEACYKLLVEQYLPELKGERYNSGYQVLLTTLSFWKSAYTAENGYGQCSEELWTRLVEQIGRDQGSTAYEGWRQQVDRSFTYQPGSGK